MTHHPSTGDDTPVPVGGLPGRAVPFGAATRAWALISVQTFGGPAGQIAVMHRTLVEEKRWIGEKRFLHALNYCMLLPGPEAQQLSIYIGWLLHGTRGGLVAGILFVLPGMLALLALSAVYIEFGSTVVVASLFAGLAPAVLAVVVQAVIRVGRKALNRPGLLVLAVVAFLALTVFAVPFPAVVAAAALAGWALGRRPHHDQKPAAEVDPGPPPILSDHELHHQAPSRRHTAVTLAVGLLAWAVPLLAAAVLTGAGSVFTQMGVFFSGTAVVTFGGAYAVLAFVAQRAVEVYGWLTSGEMVRGLGLAESTPGPLIMVVQFVAFLGAYRNPGDLDPWVAAVLASLLVTWVTFVPCFLFVFLGAPYIEKLRGNRALSDALTGVTAAVVGVIANLGLYFAIHTLFSDTHPLDWGPVALTLPDLATLRPAAAIITVIAAVLLLRRKVSVLKTLGICAALGLTAGLTGIPLT